MNKLKSKLAILLAVITLGVTAIAVIPSGNNVEMNFDTSGSDAILTEYYGSDVKVNVPETIGGKDVTTISATAFEDDSHVTMIYLPITVTTVEKDAFLNCADNLAVILELSDPLADVPTDVDKWGLGEYTAEIRHFTSTGRTDLFILKGEIVIEEFDPDCVNDHECDATHSYMMEGSIYELISDADLVSLTYSEWGYSASPEYRKITYTNDSVVPCKAIDVSEGQTECVLMWTDGDEILFKFCGDYLVMPESMEDYYNANIPDKTIQVFSFEEYEGLSYLNTSRVTNMSSAFQNNKYVTELDISSFDTSNVTDMSCMFQSMSSMESFDINHFDTTNVGNMMAMFKDCSNLTELDITNFNTENVWSLNSTFSGCSSLTELDLSNFDTSKVKTMSSLFRDMSSIEELDLTSFNTESLITMLYMFYNTSSLKDLDVSTFDTTNIFDFSSVFAYTGLETINIDSFNPSNCTSVNLMFWGADQLETVYMKNMNLSNVNYSSGMFYSATSLENLYIKNKASETIIKASTSFPTHSINFYY